MCIPANIPINQEEKFFLRRCDDFDLRSEVRQRSWIWKNVALMLDHFYFDLGVFSEEGNVTPMKECMT